MPNIESKLTQKKEISRRQFLKLLAGGGGALVFASNSILGTRIRNSEPKFQIFDALSDYTIGWDAKPWVWINLAIAAEYLNNLTIQPNSSLSLIDALRFKQMTTVPSDNPDPSKGYIAAQLGNPFELSGLGTGLCLASTAIFRAAISTPLKIVDWSTHSNPYPEYFDPVWSLGTDAAIFSSEPEDNVPDIDLKLFNPTNCPITLTFKIYDEKSNKLHRPNRPVNELFFKGSYLNDMVRLIRGLFNQKSFVQFPSQYFPQYSLGNKRIFVYVSFESKTRPKYSVSTSVPSQIAGDPKNYSWSRRVIIQQDNGVEESFIERFQSSYVK